MGMDSVELVLAIEEAFDVTLDDRVLSRVVTVGDLYDVVLAAVPRGERERCLTAVAFWRVRSALVAELGLARDEVRPDTGLSELLWPDGASPEARRAAWRRLEGGLGLALPPLRRSAALSVACVALCLAALASGVVLSTWWAAVGGPLLLALGLERATRRWRAHLPADAATTGDLSRLLVRRSASALIAPGEGFTPGHRSRRSSGESSPIIRAFPSRG